MNEYRCSNCGHITYSVVSICPNCKVRLILVDNTRPPSAWEQLTEADKKMLDNQARQKYMFKSKSRKTAVLLWALGCFGMFPFYLFYLRPGSKMAVFKLVNAIVFVLCMIALFTIESDSADESLLAFVVITTFASALVGFFVFCFSLVDILNIGNMNISTFKEDNED